MSRVTETARAVMIPMKKARHKKRIDVIVNFSSGSSSSSSSLAVVVVVVVDVVAKSCRQNYNFFNYD